MLPLDVALRCYPWMLPLDVHLVCLPDAVGAGQCLQIIVGVPVGVVDDHRVCRREIDALKQRTGGRGGAGGERY